MLKVFLRKPILWISVIVLVMLAFSIDSVPVSIMEARNFVTAREMITDGNWLLTTMNGEARYEKPPLPTWITALFGMVFGLKSLIFLRFPAIIFVAIIGIFTFLLSKKLVSDDTHSFVNALVVITSFYVIGITLEAPWDIFTHGFMLIAIYHLFQLFQVKQSFKKHAFLAGIFIGCSILCKGPISIYALLLPFLLSYGFVYRFKDLKKKIVPILGCLITALIVGGWWFIYVRLADPLTFQEIADRETSNWHSYNTKPFYYYWSFFTQSGIWTIPAFISLLYPYLKTKVSNLKAYQFSLLWTALGVVLLSLIPEKKSRYLMPVLIPLAINTGFYIDYLIRRLKDLKNKKEVIPVYFNFGLIALIALVSPVILYKVLEEKLEGHWIIFITTSMIMICLGVLILQSLKNKKMQRVFIWTIAFFVGIFTFVLPILKPTIATYNRPVTSIATKNLKIVGLNYIAPELIWQHGAKITPLKIKNDRFNFPKDKQFGLLVNNLSSEDLAELQKNYKVEKVDSVDLNTVSPDSKRYNDRLLNDYYVLTRD